MDDGKGRLLRLNEDMAAKDLPKIVPDALERSLKNLGIFREGEIVELRGSLFKVALITRTGMRLRLLPRSVAEHSDIKGIHPTGTCKGT